jgi:adenine-specific DNA-methyltransferase
MSSCLLKLGLDLCVPIETKTIVGKAVHSIGGGALIVCLADGLTKDIIDPLGSGIADMIRFGHELLCHLYR